MNKSKLTRTLMTAVSVVALSAVMYGCTHSGGDDPEPPVVTPDPDPDAEALKAAQDAAMTAWHSARSAHAELSGMEAYNPVAHQHATNALADAMGAYDAAKNATTSAEAKLHQATAEAKNTSVMKYAQEVKDVPAARTAAAAAADAAKTAYNAATMALAAVEDKKADDMASYDAATEKVADAEKAHGDATAASDKAQMATTSAGAKGHQAAAEDAKTAAETAGDAAVKYADMVSGSFNTAEQIRTDLKTVQGGTAAAADDARKARDAAQGMVDGVEDKKADDTPNFTRASDELGKAKVAYGKAKAAADAAARQPATAEGLDEARKQEGIAKAEKGKAEAASEEAEKYAGLVVMSFNEAEKKRSDEAKEREALTGAKSAAMTAADEAKNAADDARKAANTIATLLGDDHPTAVEAKQVADDAETAKGLAEDASKRAQQDTKSVDAIEEQKTAEGERDKARSGLDIAQRLESEAKKFAFNRDQGDINDYREDAMDAKNTATKHAENARAKATEARADADKARASADRANDARTDYDNANTKATAAETAATAAETAATAAETARDNAKDAYDATMAEDVTVGAAKSARDNARSGRDTASGQSNTATAQASTAMEAADGAAEDADTHVLSLFTAANAYDVTISSAAKLAEVERAGVAIKEAASAKNGDQAGSLTTASAAWGFSGNTTAAFKPDSLSITVNPEGKGAVTSRLVPTSGVVSANAKSIRGVGSFTHGFDMWGLGLDKKETENIRVIAFTDKEAPTPPTDMVEGSVTGIPVISARVGMLNGGLLDSYKNSTYDHDGDAATGVLTGEFKCATGTICSVTGKPGTSGFQISGYTFSGGGALVKKKNAMEDENYLIFGLWLNDPPNATPDSFGAFAFGGKSYKYGYGTDDKFDNTNGKNALDGLEGSATYSGNAVGAHHKTDHANGDRVSWFHGDANLTASFDNVPGIATSIGSIQGEIDKIKVDGEDWTGGKLHLLRTSFDGTSADFDGDTSMGVISSPGLTPRVFQGTWSGSFYGDDKSGQKVGGKDVYLHPEGIAGTFGATHTDDMGTTTDMTDDVTESFVGAFGAYKD